MKQRRNERIINNSSERRFPVEREMSGSMTHRQRFTNPNLYSNHSEIFYTNPCNQYTVHDRRASEVNWNSASQQQQRTFSLRQNPKRLRIFGDNLHKIEHIEFGVHRNNLAFEDLDTSIMPEFLYLTSCGCEGKIECCTRLESMLGPGTREKMKAKYLSFKDGAGYQKPYLEIRAFRRKLPSDYPEVLVSEIEGLLQLIPVDETLFRLLYYINWHAKSEYLTYWIYTEMVPLTYEVGAFRDTFMQLVRNYSKDLAQIAQNFGPFCEDFIRGCGTHLIPVAEYGKLIENLNKYGKDFLAKVLLVYLLYHKRSILINPNLVNSSSSLSAYLHSLKQKTKWGLVFNAALSSYLR